VQYKRIAIDTSKSVFALHCTDAADRAVLRRDLRRGQFEPFFAKLPPTEIVLEACGASHHWGRLLTRLGHTVKLIPPQYVKPFVKRGKSDRADAQAISEAAGRPDMRFVPVKAADKQAHAMVLTVRDQLVGQRTALINALRGHAAEFGVIAAKGTVQAGPLLAEIARPESGVPQTAQEMLAVLGEQITALDRQIKALDARLHAQFKASEACRRLAKIPGVGELTALAMTLSVDPKQFESGRHFAAWLGLTPKNKSTGGRECLGRISKAGNERLRSLLVVGATAVIRVAKPGARLGTPWLVGLLERKPRKLAAVALANKMARIIWAMMASGRAYRGAGSAEPAPQAA
jgi:transposase